MKVIQKTVNIISVLVIAAAAALFVQFLFGIRPYVVMSGSMEPAIQTGAVVFVDTKVKAPAYAVGDIIIFPRGDNTVSHRIVGEEDDAYITKGDANAMVDAYRLPKGEAGGRVLYSVPYAGYAIVALRSPTGIAAMVFFVLLYFIVTVLSDKLKLKEECRNAEEN